MDVIYNRHTPMFIINDLVQSVYFGGQGCFVLKIAFTIMKFNRENFYDSRG